LTKIPIKKGEKKGAVAEKIRGFKISSEGRQGKRFGEKKTDNKMKQWNSKSI